MKKAAPDERTLPSNLEAERAVLGALLLNPDAYDAVGEVLTATDFYRDAHRRIYSAIGGLYEAKSAVDFLTVVSELGRRGEVDESLNAGYISKLTDGLPRSTNARHYADLVRETSRLRQIVQVSSRVMSRAYAAEDTAAAIVAEADQAFMALAGHQADDRMIGMPAAVSAMFAVMEDRMRHKGAIQGVPTGFQSIDDLTGGWLPGEVVVVAARPSMGKTAWTLNTLVAAGKAGVRSVLFSLEMRTGQITDRLVAHLGALDATRVRRGFLAAGDFGKVTTALETMRSLPLHIDDRAGRTAQQIRLACRRLKREHGLGLVVVDYVQLMAGSLDRRGANRNEELDNVLTRMQAMADELSVPVVILSQLSRAYEKRTDRTPMLSDLKDSGSIEQVADVVAFLHRENHRASGPTQFIVAKQRNGATGTVRLMFDRDTQTFTDGGEEEAQAAPTPVTTPRRPRRYGS